MKRNSSLLVFAISIIIALFSCKKADNSGDAKYTMTATINGASYTGKGCTAVINGTDLSIRGNTQLPYILIELPAYAGINTYTLSTASLSNLVVNTAAVDSTSLNSPAKSIYGTVSITAVSADTATFPVVTGTFSFTALSSILDTNAASYGYVTDTVVVTNGAFTAKLLP